MNLYVPLKKNRPPKQKTTMKFTYLGHSACYLETASEKFLFDPFLTGNPKASIKPEMISPTYILLTHGHADHLGDSVAISRRSSAPIITTFELSQWLEAQGARVEPMNHGGSPNFSFCPGANSLTFSNSFLLPREGGSPHFS